MRTIVMGAVALLSAGLNVAEAANARLADGQYTAMFESACLRFFTADGKLQRFLVAASCMPADLEKPQIDLDASKLKIKGNTLYLGSATFRIKENDPNTGVLKGRWKFGKSDFDAAFIKGR